MIRCPDCDGRGSFFGGNEGASEEDCGMCGGKGSVFNGTKIEPGGWFRRSKRYIECEKCKTRNPFTCPVPPSETSLYEHSYGVRREVHCIGCGYQFE
jgi:hypothetical protein